MMEFKFQEGDGVVLKEDRTHFLLAGTCGVVFCRYTTELTSYEVNFQDVQGDEFGSVVSEDEIELVSEGVLVPTGLTAHAV